MVEPPLLPLLPTSPRNPCTQTNYTQYYLVGGTTSKRACATAPCPVCCSRAGKTRWWRAVDASPLLPLLLRQNWLAPKRRRSSRCYETRMSGAESGSAYGSFNRCARFLDRSYTLALFAPLPSQYAYRKSPRPEQPFDHVFHACCLLYGLGGKTWNGSCLLRRRCIGATLNGIVRICKICVADWTEGWIGKDRKNFFSFLNV